MSNRFEHGDQSDRRQKKIDDGEKNQHTVTESETSLIEPRTPFQLTSRDERRPRNTGECRAQRRLSTNDIARARIVSRSYLNSKDDRDKPLLTSGESLGIDSPMLNETESAFEIHSLSSTCTVIAIDWTTTEIARTDEVVHDG